MRISAGSLLLLALTALVSVTLAKSVFTFMDVLKAATVDFNQKSDEKNAFGPPKQSPLRSMSMFEPGDGSVIIKSITFTLKETVCPKSVDYLKEECVFKENGSLKMCSSTATVLKSQPAEAASLTVSCREVTDPAERKKLSEPPSWAKYFNW
ncbi:cathelicidin-2-like [Megalops cyprinoides]|uniref:cathelicidin-2-like n=1 Tax=Megalops cyprinoides TaxID=118141 RepID=UPI001863A545|nr:cathelicidin-2-like [Megalops cyprinoides]